MTFYRKHINFENRWKQLNYMKNNYIGKITYEDWHLCVHLHSLPNYPYAKIFCQVIWGSPVLLSSIHRAQGTPGWCSHIPVLPPHPAPPFSSVSELPPHWGQAFKKQGNIMQEHRKSEETGFWAGLAKSLCELQWTSGLCSAGPKPAESLPRRQGRAVHLRSLASGKPSRTWCTWWKADKPKSQYFHFSGTISRWLPNSHALWLTSVPQSAPPASPIQCSSIQ